MILQRLVKAIWIVAKCELVAMGVLLLLIILPDIPGAMRFGRHCSYQDKDALIVSESDAVTRVCDCALNGTNYAVVVMKPCRFLASGPAVLVYGPDGRLFDKTRDEGDDSRFQQTWGKFWRKSLSYQMENWLRATSLPKPSLFAPVTMGEFAKYLEKASKDFAEPLSPIARHGIWLHCNDKVAKRPFRPRPEQTATPIPDGQGHELVTFWEALTNACEQTGCTFEIVSGTIWIDSKNL